MLCQEIENKSVVEPTLENKKRKSRVGLKNKTSACSFYSFKSSKKVFWSDKKGNEFGQVEAMKLLINYACGCQESSVGQSCMLRNFTGDHLLVDFQVGVEFVCELYFMMRNKDQIEKDN